MATLSELITAKDDTPPSSTNVQSGTDYVMQTAAASGTIPPHVIRATQSSPGVDRMPQLKQLVLSTDEDISAPQPAQSVNAQTTEECIEDLLADGTIPDTSLGQAVDNLFVSWNQIIQDLSAKPGFAPPIDSNIKETAECAIRQLKDACQELTGEFARVGIEWRLAHPEEALAEDLENYDQAIMRQETLLSRAAGTIQRRLGDFANENCQGF